jgi:hypothetical protein
MHICGQPPYGPNCCIHELNNLHVITSILSKLVALRGWKLVE